MLIDADCVSWKVEAAPEKGGRGKTKLLWTGNEMHLRRLRCERTITERYVKVANEMGKKT